MNKLSGVVVVSGAASGIGRASAIAFRRMRRDSGRNRHQRRRPFNSRLRRQIETVAADLTRDEDCRRVAAAAAGLGRVTGLAELHRTRNPRHGGQHAGNRLGSRHRRQPQDDLPALQACHSSYDRRRRRIGRQHVVGAGDSHAARRRRLYRHQGRGHLAHTRHGGRSRRAKHPRDRHLSRARSRRRSRAPSPKCTAPAIRKSNSTSGAPNTRSTVSVSRSKWRGSPRSCCPKMRVSSQARITSSTAGFPHCSSVSPTPDRGNCPRSRRCRRPPATRCQ